ncbi:MAG: serine hydrolase domain-containing protein [Ilumatobacter sp.]|uniref:serine hydrolase domain-containing protein n=3 Tax=Ilumatobacter sp. TaxID=1967498 RepID=UPI00329986BE
MNVRPVIDALAPHVDAGDVSGLVAVVGRGADVEVVVLGDQAIGGAPMREESLFRIASVGKPITAAAVLTLVTDGRLRLDDPVDDILPELASPRVMRRVSGPLDDTVSAVRPILVEDLLRSTNGHGFPSDFSSPVTTRLIDELHQGPPRPQAMPAPDEWMSILGTVPLLHQPGEGFTYNTAFDILGVLVARVSGRPFTDHVEDRLLRPLAMFDTGFSSPPGSIDRMTTSYRRVDDTLEIVDGPDGEWSVEPVFASGAGGLLSTAADLLAFQRMLLDGGGEVLPRETVAAMTSDHLDPTIRDTDSVFLDGQSWGYGGGVDIAVRNPWNVIGRFGWVGGTGTSAHVVPSHDSIAILLTQTELGGPADAAVLESFWTVAAEVLGHRP